MGEEGMLRIGRAGAATDGDVPAQDLLASLDVFMATPSERRFGVGCTGSWRGILDLTTWDVLSTELDRADWLTWSRVTRGAGEGAALEIETPIRGRGLDWAVPWVGWIGRRSLGLEADAQELGIASSLFPRGPGLVLDR